MSKNTKKQLAVFLAVIMSVCSSYTMYAAQSVSKNPEAAKQEAKKNIAAIEEKQKVYLQAKKESDEKISAMSIVIHGLNTQIDGINAEITAKENEIAGLEGKVLENRDLFTKRMRALYEDNSYSTLEMLLSSKSLGDLFYRIDIVSQVAEYDQKVISDIIDQKDLVEEAKSVLADKKSEVEEVMSKREAEQDEFEAESARNKAQIDALEADKDVFEAMEAEADRLIAQKEAEIRAAEAKYNTGSAPAKITGGKLNKPANGGINTSSYGMRTHPVTGKRKMHTGLDIGAAMGTSIYAAEAGTVIVSTYESGYGNYIVISHGGGMTTLYAHCSSRLVSVGQKVTRGQVIGKVGSTGLSTGPHLHFEVRLNGVHTNPLPYIN